MHRYIVCTLALLPVLLAACAGDVQLVRPIVTCTVDGQDYGSGEGGIVAADGCNTCVCQKDGSLACTEMACVPAPDEVAPEPVVDDAAESAAPESVVEPVAVPVSEEYTIMLDEQSLGTANFMIADDKTTLQLSADLPELEAEDSYHVWLVQVEPYDAWELGILSWDEAAAQFTFEFTSFQSLANYTHLVITRGDASPTDPVIDIIRNL